MKSLTSKAYRLLSCRLVYRRMGEDVSRTNASEDAVTLTPEQREIIHRAMEMGYFSQPRRVSLVDLAEALDRPDVEVSRELRRGVYAVLQLADY